MIIFSEILFECLQIVVTIVIAVVGFRVSYQLVKKEMELSRQNAKSIAQMERMYDIPFKISEYIMMCESLVSEEIDDKRFEALYLEIEKVIICYGSVDAVKILRYIRFELAKTRDGENNSGITKHIAAWVVLLMQVKYDVTMIETSPEEWYVTYSTNYMKSLGDDYYEKSIKAVNEIVIKLNLREFLKVDQKKIAN